MFKLDSWIPVLSGQDRSVRGKLVRSGLRMLSWPYGVVVRVRNSLYRFGLLRIRRARIPVISVGNLTTGGTGKTPLVVWLSRELRRAGIRVAILSRGYRELKDGVNDEVLELTQYLPDVPNLVGADRAQLAEIAADELEMQAVILDDGFQHRRLFRDLDIVVVDALLPFGFEALLPRGLLREPISGLRRAAAVVVTRSNSVSPDRLAAISQAITRAAPAAVVVEAVTTPLEFVRADGGRCALKELTSERILAVCGLGNPQGFRTTLEELGIQPVAELVFPDHHPYAAEDLQHMAQRCGEVQASAIVCTVKDLVKIDRNRVGSTPVWALRIECQITRGREGMAQLLRPIMERASQIATVDFDPALDRPFDVEHDSGGPG